MMGITYFFIGRIYFGHISFGRAIRRQRQHSQADQDLDGQERGEADINNVTNEAQVQIAGD